jgi:hypothetical protein
MEGGILMGALVDLHAERKKQRPGRRLGASADAAVAGLAALSADPGREAPSMSADIIALPGVVVPGAPQAEERVTIAQAARTFERLISFAGDSAEAIGRLVPACADARLASALQRLSVELEAARRELLHVASDYRLPTSAAGNSPPGDAGWPEAGAPSSPPSARRPCSGDPESAA